MKESLTLSMIVRDGAPWLAACLDSVHGIVDNIVIADTGSLDDSIAMARSRGATVFVIPWHDDFAAARNAALERVPPGWVLSLDADEQLDGLARPQFAALRKARTVAGYQVTIRNYVHSLSARLWDRPARRNDAMLPAAAQYPAYVEHQNVRLFRKAPHIRFVGRVHESVGPSIERSGQSLAEAGFVIHHFGLAGDPQSQARKNSLYRRLGQQKIREMPDNAQAHFELGLVELDNFHNLEESSQLFSRARTLNPRFGLAWFFEGLTLEKLGRHAAALRCLAGAEQAGCRTALVSETRGDAHYNTSQFASACECYATAMRRDPGNASLQSKFGLATLRTGDRNRGIRALRRAVAEAPETPDVHDRLILALVCAGDVRSAATAANGKLKSVPEAMSSDFLRAASLWAKAGEWRNAAEMTQKGLRAFPDDQNLQKAANEIASAPSIPILVSHAK
jgi:tetratricopeptide (TPR) repeat protein